MTVYRVELTPDMVLHRDTTDYRGPLVIENGRLARVLFAGGYAEIRESDKVPVYHYYTLDHVGNVRAVTREDGAVVQQTDYYPFGGVIADRGFGRAVQPHKTAGKELDMMHGLGWADFGGRRYDPVLPQWTQPDPLAEKAPHMSPYRYCFNNPMRYTDRTGLFETEDEAKEWMKLKGFSNNPSSGYSIQKMNDGLWSVVDESNSVTYHKDKSLDKYEYVAGRDGDGVIKSAIASPRVSEGNMAWNSDLARTIVPDIVSVGVGGTAIAGTGAGTSFELNWITRGPDASWRLILSVTQSVGAGFSVDATLNIGGSYYMGPVQEIQRDMVNASIRNGNVNMFYSGGVAEGGKIGSTISTIPYKQPSVVNLQLNIGVSMPSPIGVNWSAGASNTYILY